MKLEERVGRITAEQWELLRRFLERETGMDFAGSRFERLRSAVARVLSLHPELSIEGEHPESQLPAAFVEHLTAELTIGESFFFRNHAHFDALQNRILPKILAENERRREIRLWSAGCAAGEEPYSLAILLDQMLHKAPPWHVTILGTDLNSEFLQRGRRGWYRPWSFRHTNIQADPRYFLPHDGGYQLCERIRAQVRFNYLNLVKDTFPSPLNGTAGMDLILFRNVAIYLKPEITAAILRRFWEALRPGGWLLLGEAELNQVDSAPYVVHRLPSATFYQKPAEAEAGHDAQVPLIPPLADAAAWKAAPAPTVPSVPDWVPLPAMRPGRDASLPQPSLGEAPPSSTPAPSASPRSRAASPPDADQRAAPLSRSTPEPAAMDSDTATAGEETASNDPRRRAKACMRQAQALLDQAQSAEARAQLELAIQDDPMLLEAYILQAGLAEDAGDLAAAEHACRRALYLDRTCCIAHFHLSLIQQQQGNAAAAAKSIRTVLQLIENHDPHELVEYGDGVCYGRLREMAQMLCPPARS